MNGDGVLDVLNHLLRAWLAGGGGSGAALQVRDVRLEPAGARVLARVDHPLASGELVIRFEVRHEGPDRYVVRARLDRLPERLGDVLAPFRDVLETARGSLELRFHDTPGEGTEAPPGEDEPDGG